jgi:16S rRNA (guanine1516-N2)-methyltransferase
LGRAPERALQVLDATAGLGVDSFVLADMGCQVLLCERSPLIAALLRSGMRAAAGADDPWLQSVLPRMRLHEGDVRQLGQAEFAPVDVIYLDPMFPERRKSAAVKKEMALLQDLLEQAVDPQDADALLVWAQQQDVARVVVKRPAKAPVLAAMRPSHVIQGKSIRYDVYVHRKLI